MVRDELSALAAFLTMAKERSFTGAAATMVLAPKLGAFARAYPDVILTSRRPTRCVSMVRRAWTPPAQATA